MKGFRVRKLLLIVWVFVLVVPQAGLVSAQSGESECTVVSQYPSGCRYFSAEMGAVEGKPFYFAFSAETTPTDTEASSVLYEIASVFEDSFDVSTYSTAYHFGEEQVTIEGTPKNSTPYGVVGIVIYRTGATVVTWVVVGEGILPTSVLYDIYEKIEVRQSPDSDPSGMVANNLPELEDLPIGFELLSEAYSDLFDMATLKRGEPSPAKEESNADLKATISALETQAAAKESAPTKVAQRPTEVPKGITSGPLEILDITTKDAGIGNGSLYAYVEVRNVTNKTLSYVMVDATCRDSSGSVVSTGISNALDLGPGDSTVLTVIFLSSPSCVRVEVKVNPLTGAF